MGGKGSRPMRLKPMPLGFADAALIMGVQELINHYGADRLTVRRWREEIGIERRKVHTPVPHDFESVAGHLTKAELQRKYEVSGSVIDRWLKLTGATAKRHVKRPPASAKSGFRYQGHAQIPAHRDLRGYSAHDAAADIIRRERFVVYRCNDLGKYAEKGKFWRVGNTVLTPDELLQRAERYRRSA